MARFAALLGHRGLVDHQAAVQPGRDDVRAADAPDRVERGAHRLAVDGTGLQRLRVRVRLGLLGFVRPARRLQPHDQGLQLGQQIRVPVPQQAPQGLGTGDAVPQDPQPAQPGGMVPCKVGRVLRALAVADAGQQVDGQQAGQGVHPAPAVPVVREALQVGHQAADGRFGKDVELWDNDGHEDCLASVGWVPALGMQDGPLGGENGLGLRTVGFGSCVVHY